MAFQKIVCKCIERYLPELAISVPMNDSPPGGITLRERQLLARSSRSDVLSEPNSGPNRYGFG